MAEVTSREGTWTFDGDTIRIVPGSDRAIHKLRKTLGEVAVPLAAVAGLAHEAGRKAGRLKLRLRDGADPFTQAVGGRLPGDADPYRMTVATDRTGAAEYFVDEVRNALLLEQVPEGASDRYLMPGPGVPISASAADGAAAFDGEYVRLQWNWLTEESKRSAGPRQIALKDISGVEWHPSIGLDGGHLRFRVNDSAGTPQKTKYDPNSLVLWGTKKETSGTALLAAAVVARIPHPFAVADAVPSATAPPALAQAPTAAAGEIPTDAVPPGAADPDDADALLRRLRELGGLHRDGVLTDEEFTAAKQAILRRL
ncbi:DUF4429 domain-containing protein [Wenjunlia tyrosinilytica]|uniref:Tat pathway signal sequence domain protein n=1 Tax=Wenjunlia tyrosinilytica TaxID=1544741 RepID=A0A917ZN23_9ACTN|nr:DUF4429 domain-containing protein [Wenjunlia tyrosinilytica]GGO87700.1 hypothetical protein GCM10012280_26770 [Wenjunlia tyrosinilytica]